MSMDETAKRILEEVGGENNIDNLTHCVTRLRFTLKSLDNVDEGRIKAIPGVLGVVNQGGQFQVIIGQQVEEAYKAIIKIADIKTSAPVVADEGDDKGKKRGVVSRVLDAIAGIFTPIMPVIAGAGMIKALLSILKLFSPIDPDGTLYYFLSFIADAAYYFLPIYLAAASAKKFHCNMYMSMLLGAMLLHPNFSALGDTGDIVNVIGLPVRIVTYSSSVIPILMIVFAYSYVERFVAKIVPATIKFIAKPLLSLLIMAPISFCVLGPLGSILGDALVDTLLAIQNMAPWALPTIIGAFMPYLVMTGMHYSLLPAYVNSLSKLGYETIIGPGNLNVINALISCAVAFIVTFAVLWFIGFEDVPADSAVDDPMNDLV